MAKKHLRKVVTDLCSELSATGFNGMRFDRVRVEKDDDLYSAHNESEMNKKQYEKYRCNYASFILEYDAFSSPRSNFFDDSEYHSHSFDEVKFLADLKKHIELKVGPGVKINYRPGCFEYEVYRENELSRIMDLVHSK